MNRILFVDDEPNVLAGLRRTLRSSAGQWEMDFAGGGREALEKMEKSRFDVLVTDIRMPGMSGAELLAEVRRRFPDTIRIVLSGIADSELTLRTAAMAHQYLCKPCEVSAFRAALAKACSIRTMLAEASAGTLIAGVGKLPSLPSVYSELSQLFDSENPSVKDVSDLISRDMAMTARVLQFANSRLFGEHGRITGVKEAVTCLGSGTVKSLTLSVMAFADFRDPKLARFSEQLSKHSFQVGVLAREIAKSAGFTTVNADDCFAAGLLHDIGKLVLADNRPTEFLDCLQHAVANGLTATEAEQPRFGFTHAEIGARLLWLWSLPDCVTEAVAMHHRPLMGGSAALAVRTADALVRNPRFPELDVESLRATGLMEHVPGWQKIQSELAA